MSICSLEFLAFILLVFAVYYIIQKATIQNIVVMIANIVFCYILGGMKMVGYIFAAAVCAYIGAIALKKLQDKRIGKIIYIVMFLLILAPLFVFKYANFFLQMAQNIQQAVLGQNGIDLLTVVAPVGISFYTLTILSYMLDVNYGIIEPEENFLHFICFAMYFPQLLSGPFNRYKELGGQFKSPRIFNEADIYDGFKRILWGVFKKKVIADRLSLVVAEIFNNYQSYQGIYLIYGIICFAFQLYADFSGYTDMVLGASQILGITISENFKAPFHARTVTEYWRRWHITLGAWCKDYIYYPFLRSKLSMNLGNWTKKKYGKKVSKNVTLYLGMFVIWFAVGFWHGGAWKYIIGSGLLHCFYICVGQLCNPLFQKVNKFFKVNTDSYSFHLFQRIRTVALVCVGFVFFRSNDVPSSLLYLKRSLMINDIGMIFNGSLFTIGINVTSAVILAIAIILLIICDVFAYRYEDARVWFNKQGIVFRYLVYWLLVLLIVLSLNLSTEEFLYMQF